MSNILFYIIIFFLIADFIFESYLSWLNTKHSKYPVPDLLSGIYDSEKYDKQQKYFRVNSKFGILSSTISFIIMLSFYAFGGFAWLDELIRNYIHNEIGISLTFFALLFLANDLLMLPFDWYDTFVIEEKFGFNKMTSKMFLGDKLKGFFVTFLIGGVILFLVIYIYQLTPNYFWLLACGLVIVFSLFFGMFYSELIVPLFNKQTALEEGELRNEIEKFSVKSGFKLDNIYLIDGSKRSTKANAYFTGLGAKKRIVLYDTLIEQINTDEIVAVLAHEIGHYKNKHTLKNYLIAIPTNLLMFFLMGLILKSDSVSQAIGASTASFHLNALAFVILYSPVSLFLNIIGNVLSRKYEFQADAFASSFGLADALISGLKKISASSLSNLTPHPLYVFFHYSHPTLYQRIKSIIERENLLSHTI